MGYCDDSLPQVSTSNYSIIHKLLNKFNKFNYEFKTHQILQHTSFLQHVEFKTKTNTINSVYTTLSLPLTLSRACPLSPGHVLSNSPPVDRSLRSSLYHENCHIRPYFLKIQHLKYSTYVCFMFCMSMPHHLIYHECSSNNKCHRVPGKNKISFLCFAVANHQNKS